MVDNEGEARFSAAVVLEGDCGEEEGVEVGGVPGGKEENRKG